jgi:hypothetical protein
MAALTQIFIKISSSGYQRLVNLEITELREECKASIITVKIIGGLETTLAVTSILRSLRRLLVTANVVHSSPTLVTLMIEAVYTFEKSILTKAT